MRFVASKHINRPFSMLSTCYNTFNKGSWTLQANHYSVLIDLSKKVGSHSIYAMDKCMNTDEIPFKDFAFFFKLDLVEN